MTMMCWNFFWCYDPCCVFMAWQIIPCRSLLEGFFFLHNHMGIKHTYIYTHTHAFQSSCSKTQSKRLVRLCDSSSTATYCSLQLEAVYIYYDNSQLFTLFFCVSSFFYTPKCFGYPDTQMRDRWGGHERRPPPKVCRRTTTPTLVVTPNPAVMSKKSRN